MQQLGSHVGRAPHDVLSHVEHAALLQPDDVRGVGAVDERLDVLAHVLVQLLEHLLGLLHRRPLTYFASGPLQGRPWLHCKCAGVATCDTGLLWSASAPPSEAGDVRIPCVPTTTQSFLRYAPGSRPRPRCCQQWRQQSPQQKPLEVSESRQPRSLQLPCQIGRHGGRVCARVEPEAWRAAKSMLCPSLCKSEAEPVLRHCGKGSGGEVPRLP